MHLWPAVLNLIGDLNNICNNYYCKIPDLLSLKKLCKYQWNFVEIMATQLNLDLNDMKDGNPISICSKWAPTEKDSMDKKYNVVNTLCISMKCNHRQYRKTYISPLRQYLQIVEMFMCKGNWDLIEYNRVPSCAMKRLKSSFEKHSEKQFADWKLKLQKGETSINAKQLFPHELIAELRIKNHSDQISEAQWKVLENETVKLGSMKNTLFVVDVSGSMGCWGYKNNNNISSFIPMDVSIALGILASNSVSGVFHNHIITFHEKPKFFVLPNGSAWERYSALTTAPWGGSTNLQATFDLILEKAKMSKLLPEDMPKRVFIISDMQFDKASYLYTENMLTNFKTIEQKYIDSGYTRHKLFSGMLTGQLTIFQYLLMKIIQL